MANAQQITKHVVLVSIDGLRPEFYLDPQYPAPNLQNIKAHGVYARKMKSVFPSYTYPSHTAMMTGALPTYASKACHAPPASPPAGGGVMPRHVRSVAAASS